MIRRFDVTDTYDACRTAERRDIVEELSTRADILDYLTREHQCPACDNHTLHALY